MGSSIRTEPGDGHRNAMACDETPEGVCHALFEAVPDAIVVFDDSGIIRHVNPGAASLWGGPDKLIGSSLDLRLSAVRSATNGAAAVSGSGSCETTGADGRRLEVDYVVRANVAPGLHLVLVHDVSARRKRAELLDRYRLLSKYVRDIVLFMTPEGRIRDANEAAERAYGYPREDLLRLSIHDLRAPGTRALITTQLKDALERGTSFESVHQRHDGTTFPVEITASSERNGDDTMIVSVIRDVSERKHMEAKLVHADRLAAVGTLAAGVAHEINNPLAYAMTNLELVARNLSRLAVRVREASDRPAAANPTDFSATLREIDKLGEMVAVAREGADRVRAIVRDLRTFARADEVRHEVVDLAAVLESSISMAQNELRHRATLVREYEPAPKVLGNEGRLGQVFLNLLVNAVHALPEGTHQTNRIIVRTGTDCHGSAFAEVSDTGVGIPAHVVARIFDPFVTSKPVGEGMGLGLFISHAIVTRLGGEITVESERGRGTTFRVVLPPVPENDAAPPGTLAWPPAFTETQLRLLVVDDEAAIGDTLRAALSDSFDVHVARSGAEALAFLENTADVDVILCDVMMPNMTGIDLFEEVKRRRPNFARRFVFMTGGAFTPMARAFFSAHPHRSVDKPFDLNELRAVLYSQATGK